RIFFSLHSEGNELFHLPSETLKQRIVHLFGNNYNQRLVPVEEDTTIITVSGFIGKPEFAKKTRGEQFFFVNKRFVKDPYLHHAVMNAYEDILPTDTYPLYVLLIEIDPSKIDINVHPTKTEIKYEDDKAMYAILRSTVKRSLGRSNITPTLDFNQETSITNFIPNNRWKRFRHPRFPLTLTSTLLKTRNPLWLVLVPPAMQQGLRKRLEFRKTGTPYTKLHSRIPLNNYLYMRKKKHFRASRRENTRPHLPF